MLKCWNRWERKDLYIHDHLIFLHFLVNLILLHHANIPLVTTAMLDIHIGLQVRCKYSRSNEPIATRPIIL